MCRMNGDTPTDYPPLSISLAVKDSAKAIEFYKAAFGAVELYRLVDPQSGRIGHAEIRVHGYLVMLADEYPPFNKTPESLGGTPVKLCLFVESADAAIARAVSAGATVLRPTSNQFYGHRCGAIRDPFGHEWMISQEMERVPPAEMQRRWDAMAKA
jgi:PhnB protein